MSEPVLTEAVSEREGEEWQPFGEYTKRRGDKRIHAIKFSDGRIWDAVNGWCNPPRDAPKPVKHINSPEYKSKCIDWALQIASTRGADEVLKAADQFYKYVYGDE